MHHGELRHRHRPYAGAAIEQHHDDKGIIWPVPIAPYQVDLCPFYREGTKVGETVEKINAKWKPPESRCFSTTEGIARHEIQ